MIKFDGDTPVGLALELSKNSKAMQYYSTLPYEEQRNIVKYVQNHKTGMEMSYRIVDVMNGLENKNLKFLH